MTSTHDPRRYQEDLDVAAGLPRLLDALRDAAAGDGARREWQSDVACALARVEVAWTAHAAADEDPEGFLAASQQQSPRFAHLLEHQRSEHGELRAAIDTTRATLIGATLDDEMGAARADVLELARRLCHHLERSDCIAWEIANDDLGTGD